MSTTRGQQASAHASLYRELLGESFDGLHESLRRAHSAPLEAAGSFDVRHGSGRLVALLVKMMSLPRAGIGVDVHLSVTEERGKMRWRREIGPSVLTTTQTRSGRHMVERNGPGAVVMDVTILNGEVIFEQRAMKLLGIPLPFAPIVLGRVSPAGIGWRVEVSVTWRSRLVCRYEGVLRPR